MVKQNGTKKIKSNKFPYHTLFLHAMKSHVPNIKHCTLLEIGPVR